MRVESKSKAATPTLRSPPLLSESAEETSSERDEDAAAAEEEGEVGTDRLGDGVVVTSAERTQPLGQELPRTTTKPSSTCQLSEEDEDSAEGRFRDERRADISVKFMSSLIG